MKCKICPVCNARCSPEDMICGSCLTSMDSVEIIECDEAKKEVTLKLVFEDNTLDIEEGDIVGREARGEKFLEDKLTVSREHAKFVQKHNQWYVIDMGSTNKSYVNGKEIKSNKEVLLHDGDELGLSLRVVFKVKL